MATNGAPKQGNHDGLILAGLGVAGAGGLLWLMLGNKSSTPPGGCGIAAGSLVVDGAKPTGQFTPFYYITADCHKRWIASVADGEACGWDLQKTIPVNGALIDAIPTGATIFGPPDCPPLGVGF